MSDFVNTPMSSEFVKDNCDPPAGSTVNGEKVGPFGGFPRTSSPNAESEVTYDKMKGGTPSGESDQF